MEKDKKLGAFPAHRPDRKGRMKGQRHGTRSWTTWITERRMNRPRWVRMP